MSYPSCTPHKKTVRLPQIGADLRNINRLGIPRGVRSAASDEHFWNSITGGPFLMPVIRWIE